MFSLLHRRRHLIDATSLFASLRHLLAQQQHHSTLASSTDTFSFDIIHTSKKSNARAGIINTPHGQIHTPAFVGVATNAALKCLTQTQVTDAGQQIMFCNTYHLLLHPGKDTVKQAGGLHTFMNWNKPIITDSGGFQVFSLKYGTVHEEVHRQAPSLKRASGRSMNTRSLVLNISEEGVLFESYRDGSKLLLTPESSVDAQKSFGADIILPLDELPPYHASREEVVESLARSHRWMERSLKRHQEDTQNQAMYGIVHGGLSLDLRQESITFLESRNGGGFDGLAVGGALGKDREELFYLLSNVSAMLPPRKPVHVLGIADPKSINALVPMGYDTFDSAYATRVGRHGMLLGNDGTTIKLSSRKYKNVFSSPVEGCGCYTCCNHTLAYLHHLKKAHEPGLSVLASIHNIFHMNRLMEKWREGILNDAV